MKCVLQTTNIWITSTEARFSSSEDSLKSFQCFPFLGCPLCLVPYSEVLTDVLGAKTFKSAIQLREHTNAACQCCNRIIEIDHLSVGFALLASVGYKFLAADERRFAVFGLPEERSVRSVVQRPYLR